MARKKITMKNFKVAVIGSGGIHSVIGERLGVTRQTVGTFLKQNPKAREILDDSIEMIIDVAESKLFKKINDGRSWAIRYFLDTKGKSRGYIPTQHTDHTTGGEKLSFFDIISSAENEKLEPIKQKDEE